MPSAAPTRDFYLAATSVAILLGLGFWGYHPATQANLYIAIIATVAIVTGFFRRAPWARGAAILVSAFSIFGDAVALGKSDAVVLLFVRIAFAIFVIWWLNRSSVRKHFAPAKSA